MNEINEFARLRPADQIFDAATSERIWAKIHDTAPPSVRQAEAPSSELGTSSAIHLVAVGGGGNLGGRPQRRVAALGAAAAVLIGVVGLVALQPASSATPAVATLPESASLPPVSEVPVTTPPVTTVPVTTVPDIAAPVTTVPGMPFPTTTVPDIAAPVTTVPGMPFPTTTVLLGDAAVANDVPDDTLDELRAPRLTLDLEGWQVALEDLDERVVRDQFDHVDGRRLDVTVEAGGLDVYLARVSAFSPGAVEVIDDISQVADLATNDSYRFDAVLEPGNDWVLQAVGTGFADRADFVATIAALERTPDSDR